MKTYLTEQEFVNVFWKFYERSMTANYNADTSDKILWGMFQEYETDVKETLEGSLWNIDEYERDKSIELIGYQFHKSVRQTDVIPAKHIDGIVWTCMQTAPVFWKALERACKVLQSADAADVYKDEVL